MTHIGHTKNSILCKIFNVLCKMLFYIKKAPFAGCFLLTIKIFIQFYFDDVNCNLFQVIIELLLVSVFVHIGHHLKSC